MTSSATAPRISGSAGTPTEWLVRSVAEKLDRAGIVVAWLPCATIPPSSAFALAPPSDRTAWIGADGTATVGAGVALELHAAGPQRFSLMQRLIENAYDSLRIVAADGARTLDPRLYGGFAFRPGGADEPPWSRFGDSRFVLPRLLYRQDGGGAQVGAVISTPTSIERQVQQLVRWRDSLENAPGLPCPPPATHFRTDSSPDLRDRIARAVEATNARGLDKVVVASCQTLELTPAPDPATTLARLLRESPTATKFAFDCHGSCFLGASPERLVLRRGLEVSSEALAGSIRLAPGLDAVTLLGSAKDRNEHAFVVRAIRDALEPACVELHAPDEPVLRMLQRVAHLSTPVVGRLRTNLHVLELVRRLHPTPAVGGSPTEAALEWIQANEPRPRGWYAGPVGWVDADGNGEFVVALRSGTLCGSQALLFAGAGVVQGSIPDAEVAEIDVKLATFRSAVGVSSQ